MNILIELHKKLLSLSKGQDLVLHQKDLFTILGKGDSSASRMFLVRAVAAGIVQNPTRRIYVFSPTGRINPQTIYKIARKLRSGCLNYLSLESVLSQSGMIPQLPIDRITIMTSGRSQVFELEGLGVIEFTHTKKTMDTLAENLIWDEDIQMFKASPDYALRELKRIGRNLEMIWPEEEV